MILVTLVVTLLVYIRLQLQQRMLANLQLNITKVAIDEAATNANNVAAGTVLEAIGVAGDDDGNELEGLLVAIQNAPTVAAVNAAIEQGTAATDNSLTQGIFDATVQSVDVVNNRIATNRAASNDTASIAGIAAGNGKKGHGAWIQGYGGISEQDNKNGISGYDADTYGIAIGADKKINDRFTLGVSGSASKTDVDNNSGSKKTDVDSYQVNLYGSWEKGQYYVDGIVGAAFNNYETTRSVAPASTARADFDGQTYVAKAETGYIHTMKNGVQLTPNASLTYAHNTVDNYTETGAGVANLTVDNQDADRLEAKLGVKAAKTFTTGRSMKLRPEVRLAVAHDFIGDEQQATSNFQGVGTAFRTTGGDIEKTSFEAGVGVDLMNTRGMTLSADYDYTGKSDYSSHIGALKVRYDF